MPDFSRVIRLAYQRILGREPDPGGLAAYNELMNGGTSEAAMRESLLRSPEYTEKNPGGAARARVKAGRRPSGRRPAGARKKVKSRKAR
jgi:hypothetical protein